MDTADRSNDNWLVIKTKPRQEQRALDNLANQSFDSYLPKLLIERIQRGKRVQKLEPMFPGYVFVKINELAEAFYKIRSSYGVAGIVRFGDTIASVNGQIIKELQALERQQACAITDRTPNVGDEVEITQGPFRGVKAKITELKGDERCVVLLNWLNQQPVKAEFSYSELNKS